MSFTESFVSLTDPLTKDNGSTGVSDDKRDTDKDRLSNSEEQKHGTNPLNKDTDGDGIDDKSEINGTGGYVSDPVKEDTLNKINNQINDQDKLNIIIKKYTSWGIEHFDSDEWRCNADYYSYINKYSKGDTITHKLNVAPF